MPKVNREAGEVYVPITAEGPGPLDPLYPNNDKADYSGLNVLSPRMLEKLVIGDRRNKRIKRHDYSVRCFNGAVNGVL